jgi:hypothetical protein
LDQLNNTKKENEVLRKANDNYKEFLENYAKMKENSISFDVILEFADNKKLQAHKTILEGT